MSPSHPALDLTSAEFPLAPSQPSVAVTPRSEYGAAIADLNQAIRRSPHAAAKAAAQQR